VAMMLNWHFAETAHAAHSQRKLRIPIGNPSSLSASPHVTILSTSYSRLY